MTAGSAIPDADQPAPAQPAASRPAPAQLAPAQLAPVHPVPLQPVPGQPIAGQSTAGQPTVGQAATGLPAAEPPATGLPAAGQLATSLLATGQLVTGRPPTEQPEAEARRVSTLELFFDLVFVFLITQLTVLLARDLSVLQGVRVLMVLTVLFWMYGAYAYLTNQVPPETLVRRIPLLLGMCGFMTCALAVPRVFAGDGVAFGLGFLLVTVVHGVLYAILHGRYVLSFAITNGLAAVCVTLAGAVRGTASDALWVAALVLQNITPIISSRIVGNYTGQRTPVTDRVGGLDPAHFVERHGLLLLIVFGESVVAIGAGASGVRLDWALFGGIALALAMATTLWWTYFVRDEAGAEAALHRANGSGRFRLTMRSYYYCFVPMLMGVIILATGMKLAVAHLPDRLPAAPAVALAAGVTVFLLGNVAFRAVLGLRPLVYRIGGAAVALATSLLGMGVAALAELAGLVVVLVLMLVVESLASR